MRRSRAICRSSLRPTASAFFTPRAPLGAFDDVEEHVLERRQDRLDRRRPTRRRARGSSRARSSKPTCSLRARRAPRCRTGWSSRPPASRRGSASRRPAVGADLDDRPVVEDPLHFGRRAEGRQPAGVDERDPVAALGLVQVVRRHQHGDAVRATACRSAARTAGATPGRRRRSARRPPDLRQRRRRAAARLPRPRGRCSAPTRSTSPRASRSSPRTGARALPPSACRAGARSPARPAPLTSATAATGAEDRWMRVRHAGARRRRPGDAAINVVEDITELKRAEATQRLLAEASRVAGALAGLRGDAAPVARLAVPELADWCMVDLARAATGARGGRARRPGAARARRASCRALPARSGTDRARPRSRARAGRAATAQVADELLRAAARELSTSSCSRGRMRSAMIVPMTRARRACSARSRFVIAESGRRFDAQRLALAEDLALRAARGGRERAAVPRSARRSRARCRSRCCRRCCPSIAGLELAARLPRRRARASRSAATSTTSSPPARTSGIVVIGDVCGKGAEAAAVTALARYTIRARGGAAALTGGDPALAQRRDAAPGRRAGGRFCTVACVHIDAARDGVRGDRGVRRPSAAARAARADGTVEDVRRAGDAARPACATSSCRTARRELRAGDTLVLYTDGLTEARRARARVGAGRARRRRAARPPHGSAQAIVDGLVAARSAASPRPARRHRRARAAAGRDRCAPAGSRARRG